MPVMCGGFVAGLILLWFDWAVQTLLGVRLLQEADGRSRFQSG